MFFDIALGWTNIENSIEYVAFEILNISVAISIIYRNICLV